MTGFKCQSVSLYDNRVNFDVLFANQQDLDCALKNESKAFHYTPFHNSQKLIGDILICIRDPKNNSSNRSLNLIPFGNCAESFLTGEKPKRIDLYIPTGPNTFFSCRDNTGVTEASDGKTFHLTTFISALERTFGVDRISPNTVFTFEKGFRSELRYYDCRVNGVNVTFWFGKSHPFEENKGEGKTGEKSPHQWFINTDGYLAFFDRTITVSQFLKEQKERLRQMTTSTPAPQMTKTQEKTIGTLIKQDFTKAATRVAADQMTAGIKAGLTKMLTDDGLSPEKAKLAQEMLDNPFCEALIKLTIGYGGTHLPVDRLQNDPRFTSLMEEFRVSGQASGMNQVVTKMMKYVVPAMTAALDSLPPIMEDKMEIRIVENAKVEETENSVTVAAAKVQSA